MGGRGLPGWFSARVRCTLCGFTVDVTGLAEQSKAEVLQNHLLQAHTDLIAYGEAGKPQLQDPHQSFVGGSALDGAEQQSADAAPDSADPSVGASDAPPISDPPEGQPETRDDAPQYEPGTPDFPDAARHQVDGETRDTERDGERDEASPVSPTPPAGPSPAGAAAGERSRIDGQDQQDGRPDDTGAGAGQVHRSRSAAANVLGAGGIAGLPKIPGAAGSGPTGAGPQVGSAGDRVGGAAFEGAAAAAGVKPAIDAAEALANMAGLSVKRPVKKAIKWALWAGVLLVVMLMIAVFGGTLTSTVLDDGSAVWSVDEAENLDIPLPYLEAYRQYGSEYKIPWTLLAAVGAQATYHGRVDPYQRDIPRVVGAGGAPSGPVSGIYVLGDSLSVGTEAPLARLGDANNFAVTTEATTGISAGNTAANAYSANPAPAGSVVIIGLGTNNNQSDPGAFARAIDSVMNVIGATNRVYWLTIDIRDPENLAAGTTAEALNQEIRAAQARWANLRVADWAGYAASNGISPGGDGIHYSSNGYEQRAEYIMGLATSAAAGGGAAVTAVNLDGPGVLPTPEGTCPTLPVPVAGEFSSQGAGPLMLNRDALEQVSRTSVRDSDIQNICWSLDKLGAHIQEVAEQVADERGIPYPRGLVNLAKAAGDGDGEAAATVVEFWATTMDRLVILGDVRSVNCAMPAKGSFDNAEWIGVGIDKVWACELSRVGLSSVHSVVRDQTGVSVQQTLSQVAAVRRAVDEALTVAWLWSAWGDAPCNADNPGPTGVFPLTQDTFERYLPTEPDGESRCNPEANIRAAARAFAAGESVNAAVRGAGWAGAVGGWATVGTVPGGVGTVNSFTRHGPWEPMTVGTVCLNLAFFELLDLAERTTVFGTATAQQVQSYIDQSPNDPLRTAVQAELRSLVPRLAGDPRCAQTREYTAGEWIALVSTAFISDPARLSTADAGGGVTPTGGATEVPVGESQDGDAPLRPRPALTRGDLTVTAGVGDRFAALGAEAGRFPGGVTTAQPAVTALIQRLSPERLRIQARPAVTLVGGGLTSGMEYVNIAMTYGGLYRGTGGVLMGAGMANVGAPVPYADIFNSVGAQYGIDPRLLAAVAKGESGFNPDANCPTQGPAFGMMQLEGGSEVCGDVRLQVERAAQMLLGLFDAAGDWRGAIWGYNNGIKFAQAWSTNNGFSGDLGMDGAAYQYAREHYCADPARRARQTASGQSWCEWRAGVAMKYISDVPGTHSVWLFWLEYQQLFPAAMFTATGPGIHIDYVVGSGTPQLVRVEGFTVNVQIANEFGAMVRAARAAGIELGGGAYRSTESQIELRKAHCGTSTYAIYEMPSSQCSPPTARPGQSLHEQGLAADFKHNGSYLGSHSSPAFIWLAANAASYGFYNFPPEPWHWSVTGG
jgi:hypothetical protein